MYGLWQNKKAYISDVKQNTNSDTEITVPRGLLNLGYVSQKKNHRLL